MCLKTDTILLQYTLDQFQYFITTYICTWKSIKKCFSFNGNDLMVLFNWGSSRLINKPSLISIVSIVYFL